MEQLTKGLALEELEAHSFAQLLPDRIDACEQEEAPPQRQCRV
jgi:hypothetical protein